MNRNNLALENYAERAVKMQNNILCSHSLSQYSFVDYAQIMFFFYYAPLCLYALTSYYAQNYASIIRQDKWKNHFHEMNGDVGMAG